MNSTGHDPFLLSLPEYSATQHKDYIPPAWGWMKYVNSLDRLTIWLRSPLTDCKSPSCWLYLVKCEDTRPTERGRWKVWDVEAHQWVRVPDDDMFPDEPWPERLQRIEALAKLGGSTNSLLLP